MKGHQIQAHEEPFVITPLQKKIIIIINTKERNILKKIDIYSVISIMCERTITPVSFLHGRISHENALKGLIIKCGSVWTLVLHKICTPKNSRSYTRFPLNGTV